MRIIYSTPRKTHDALPACATYTRRVTFLCANMPKSFATIKVQKPNVCVGCRYYVLVRFLRYLYLSLKYPKYMGYKLLLYNHIEILK